MAHQRRRQRLTYTLSDSEHDVGHRFGVNSLLFNQTDTLLYTAGRDSVVRCWDISNPDYPPQLLRKFSAHADWVNAMCLTGDNSYLLTASSDTTIRLLNLGTKGDPHTACLRRHEDAVKALALASETDVLFSTGLDGRLVSWDLRQLLDTGTTTPAICKDEHTESIYSTTTNPSGSIVVTGSPDKTIRTFDARTMKKITSLKGHGDNIKALAVSADGTRLLSGSSDRTVKLWDLGQQRCIATYGMHADSVWSLEADPNFDYFYSGGRDGAIFFTDLHVPQSQETSVCLVTEPAPILCVRATRANRLWVSTTVSSMSCWDIDLDAVHEARQRASDNGSHDDDTSEESVVPLVAEPTHTIPGLPGVTQYHLLNDRIHALTKDTDGNVAKWSLLDGQKVNDYGQADFEATVRIEFEQVHVRPWCTLDVKLGSLSVHLDEPECFSAWASSLLIRPDLPYSRVNIGGLVVQALLAPFQENLVVHDRRQRAQQQGEQLPPLDDEAREEIRQSLVDRGLAHRWFAVNPETSIVLSQRGEQVVPITKFIQKDAARDMALKKQSGQWILDALQLDNCPFGTKYSSPNKIIFHLLPHTRVVDEAQRLGKLETTRLTCPEVLLVSLVAKHVADGVKLDLGDRLPEDVVEVYCQASRLDPKATLATVKHYFWKKADELVLTYCLSPGKK